MRPAVDRALVGVGAELAVRRGDRRLGHLASRAPRARRRYSIRSAIEISFRPCSAREADQLGQPRHRAVLVHHLADHAGREQPGEPCEVDRRLRVAGAPEHAALFGAQREDVPGPGQSSASVSGSTIARTVAARSRALVPVVTPGRASTDTVNAVSSLRCCRRPSAGSRARRAASRPPACRSTPRPCRDHEVDRLGRHLLRRHDEVALVLAIGVVDDDHHPAGADVLERLLDRRERGCPRDRFRSFAHRHVLPSDPSAASSAMSRSTYFAITSISRFTRSPGTDRSQRGHGERVRDQGDAHPVAGERGDRQAHAVHGDRSLLHRVAEQGLGHPRREHGAALVVALDRRRPHPPRRRAPGRGARRAARRASPAAPG